MAKGLYADFRLNGLGVILNVFTLKCELVLMCMKNKVAGSKHLSTASNWHFFWGKMVETHRCDPIFAKEELIKQLPYARSFDPYTEVVFLM